MNFRFIYLLISLVLLSACDFVLKTPQQMQEEINKEIEISNARFLGWRNFLDSVEQLARRDGYAAIKLINDTMLKSTSLEREKLWDLYFLKGDIYYAMDNFEKAIVAFSSAGKLYNEGMPKDLVARAGAYVKVNEFDKAITDLRRASAVNHQYLWNIGNFFEITGKKDSAIWYYDELFKKDTVIYKYCADRKEELLKPRTKLLTEFEFKDRNPVFVLMKGVTP